MIIKTLSPLSFGRFQNRHFELDRGVNLIEAPNEAGKSTLAAFLSGMLYGFFRRELKKRLYAPAYDRYLPWDNPGRYMGAMTVEHDGVPYRIERNFLKDSDSVRLLEEATGRDVSELMPYNPALRIREPGQFFLGISQTAFEGTLYVPQQSVGPGDALGAELADRIDALSQTGSNGLSAAGAIKWLDEQRGRIGTPGRSASPLGSLHKKLAELSAERRDSERKREQANEDAARVRTLQAEIEELEKAQREDEAAFEQAKRFARWKRAESARAYRARALELESRLTALSRYENADEALLAEAVSGARLMDQLTKQADDTGRLILDLDGRILGARERARSTGLDDEKCALSDALERGDMRVAMLEGDLAAKCEAEIESRRALPPQPPVSPQRAASLMARFEALPETRPTRASVALGAILIALSLTGLIHPLGYALLIPGAALLLLGILRGQKHKKVEAERAAILSELDVRSPDEFDAVREALGAREWAERALEAAKDAAYKSRTARDGAARDQVALLEKAAASDLDAFREALAQYEAALDDARELQIRRAALLEQRTAARDQAAVHARVVERALSATGADAGADDIPGALSESLRLSREYRETRRALDDAARLLAECLGADGYDDLIASALPEEEPARPADALALEIERRAALIREKTRDMDRRAASRDAIEDACRTPVEIDGALALLQEEIDALTREAEAIDLAKARIERVATEMRKELSPALGRAITSVASRVTEGRYDRLSIDTKLTVSAQASGQTISPDRLSGGTADAMYLALRLGLIEFLMDGREFPVLMDDSFSQLDDSRAERMLAAVSDALAKRGQLLLMTCQSRTRRMLESLEIPFRAVEL